MRRTEESIEEGYKEPRCTRLRDNAAFNDLGDLDECDCVIKKKTGEICGAPKFCHFSSSALCKLTQDIIYSKEDRYITTNNLCITCLQKKVCCLAADHLPTAQTGKYYINNRSKKSFKKF
jgi:hypothetical protein